nr:hypothetical protein [Ralstonia sp. ASV6]
MEIAPPFANSVGTNTAICPGNVKSHAGGGQVPVSKTLRCLPELRVHIALKSAFAVLPILADLDQAAADKPAPPFRIDFPQWTHPAVQFVR